MFATSTIFVFLALPLTIAGAFLLSLKDRIYLQTYLGYLDLSGMTVAQATSRIEAKMKFQKPIKLDLIDKDQPEKPGWQINLEELGLKYSAQKTAKKAYSEPRKDPIQGLTNNNYLELEFIIDQSALETRLATIAAEVYQPDIPTQISLDPETKEVLFNLGQAGQELQIEETKKTILGKIAQMDFEQPVVLSIKKLSRLPSETQIRNAKERAKKLSDKILTLTSKQQNFVVQNGQLVDFIGLFSDWETKEIIEYVEVIAQSMNRPAENALFQFQDGKVNVFKPDQKGYRLDKNLAVATIRESLDQLSTKDNGNVAKELPLEELSPEISASDTNELGIVSLIAQGESWFSHSISSRIHNVDLASNKIHGHLIAPGEVFSINQTLGDISRATGYKDAYIIKDGKTVLGAGGGVCQVSTTLFRAAINSGLPIVERHAHAYRVSYYEENYDVGFDATVYAPSSDLKFKNDTQNHILIQRVFDSKNHYLSFNFYGTPDNRKVEISNIRLWGISAPPEDLYIDDPTLAVGVVKQIDFKSWGAKAAFDWKVLDNQDNLLQEETFYSNYRPWQAIFLRGSK